MKFVKGKSYSYSYIRLQGNDDYMLTDNDVDTLGLGFITLEHNQKDIIHSFVLEASTAIDYYYICAYTDD